MSEPLSSDDIEDVVSSVRRLVSPEARPRPMSRDLGSDRLILTPALRIVAEPSANGPTIVKLETVARKSRPKAKKTGVPSPKAPVTDAAVLNTSAGGVAESPEFGLSGLSLAEMVLGAEEAELTFGDDRGTEAPAIAIEKAAMLSSPPVTSGKTRRKTKPDLGKSKAAKDSTKKATSVAKSRPQGSRTVGEPVKAPKARPASTRSNSRAPMSDQVETKVPARQQEVAELSSVPVRVEGSSMPVEPLLALTTPIQTEVQVALPAAGLTDRSVFAAEAEAFPEVETEVAELPVTDEAATLVDSNGNPVSLMDEEALIALVRQVIREELQGVLGEKITRNVRKLVRAEIARALTAQTLE